MSLQAVRENKKIAECKWKKKQKYQEENKRSEHILSEITFITNWMPLVKWDMSWLTERENHGEVKEVFWTQKDKEPYNYIPAVGSIISNTNISLVCISFK